MLLLVHWCVQELHGGVLLKISSAAEDDFIRLNLLWTGFFGETCKSAFRRHAGGQQHMLMSCKRLARGHSCCAVHVMNKPHVDMRFVHDMHYTTAIASSLHDIIANGSLSITCTVFCGFTCSHMDLMLLVV
jgi:hypothetical protein